MNNSVSLAAKKNSYPTKRTVNLNMKDTQPVNLKVVIPAVALLCILVGLFCKLAVIDRIAEANAAERDAAAVEQKLADVNKKLESYDEVKLEYDRYVSSAFRPENMPRSCEQILALLENTVMPHAGIYSISFSENTVRLELIGTTPDSIAAILSALDGEPSVAGKTIETAASTIGGAPTAVLTITLQEVKDDDTSK